MSYPAGQAGQRVRAAKGPDKVGSSPTVHLAKLERQLIASVTLEDHGGQEGASSGACNGLRGRPVRRVHRDAKPSWAAPWKSTEVAEDPLTAVAGPPI